MFKLRSAVAFRLSPQELTVLAGDQGIARRVPKGFCRISIISTTTFPTSTAGSIALSTQQQTNQFIDRFYDLITLIFHYHYQWNKRDERQRNEVALEEHLSYIDALLVGTSPP